MDGSGVGMQEAQTQIGILTVSDRCYRNEATDGSSKNLISLIQEKKIIPGVVVVTKIVPDEEDQIKSTLVEWSDIRKLDVLLTTGGTGFSPRDVTPEATKSVLEKEALGMTLAMLKQSLEVTPLAMLSRLACGIRGKTLIINLPGSVKASEECLRFVSPGIPHAVSLLKDKTEEIQTTHTDLQSRGVEVPASGKEKDAQNKTIGICRREVEKSIDNNVLHKIQKTPIFRTRPKRKIQYSPISNTISCIRLDRQETLTDELLKKRDSYTPADENSRDVYSMETESVHSDKTDNTDTSRNTSYPEQEEDNQQPDPSDHLVSSAGSMQSLDLIGLSDWTNDKFLITGPPSVPRIGVESPSTNMMCGKAAMHDTSVTMLERPVPPSFTIPKNLALNDHVSVAQRIMGKDITSCFEPIEKIHMNFSESDSDDDIDISASPSYHSDGESTIPYEEDSENDFMHDDQESQTDDVNVYDFDMEANLMSPPASKTVKKSVAQARRMRKRMDKRCGFLGAKLHKSSMFGEVNFVDVGLKVHKFLKEHPMIQGIYLNKGKRAIKKNYVTLCRQKNQKDNVKLSWKRGEQRQGRNCLDDYFEYTEEGRARKSKIERKLVRDEYTVSWYMWCPGHGNCIRKCGGRGKCVSGCRGMHHKQDRHNCKVMLIFKLYLSDLTKWRVQITGLHVPKGTTWLPPQFQERAKGCVGKEAEILDVGPSVLEQFEPQNPMCKNNKSDKSSPHVENQIFHTFIPKIKKSIQQTKDNPDDSTQKMAHLVTPASPYNLNNDLLTVFPKNSSLVISPSLLSEPITDAEANQKIIEWISESPGNDVIIPRLPPFDM